MKLKTYTGDIDSDGNELIVLSIIIFNDRENDRTAYIDLFDRHGKLRNRILETTLRGKETVFLDTKIIIADGDILRPFGGQFTVGVSENVF